MFSTFAIASAATIGLAPSAAAERSALERYRPVLRYDRSERDYPRTVEAVVRGDRVVTADGPVVYGREQPRPEGGAFLQYWIFYAYNGQDRGILRTGRHEGDWELVQLRLDARDRLVRAVVREHSWAQRCTWDELLKGDGEAPVVFVANGSHANYSRAGVHDRPWPDPNDEADGRGRTLRPPVETISERRPPWMAWRGRFGRSVASFVPAEQSSPRGPAFQEPWADPAGFEADARGCLAAPPGRAWLTALALGVLAGVAGLVALARRRP